jgi:four helix bundle protein
MKLDERIFSFVIKVFEFLRTLEKIDELYDIKRQLRKSSPSVGANYLPRQIKLI